MELPLVWDDTLTNVRVNGTEWKIFSICARIFTQQIKETTLAWWDDWCVEEFGETPASQRSEKIGEGSKEGKEGRKVERRKGRGRKGGKGLKEGGACTHRHLEDLQFPS